jgi:hypothetical protein
MNAFCVYEMLQKNALLTLMMIEAQIEMMMLAYIIYRDLSMQPVLT